MAQGVKTRIKLPKVAAMGEVITIKTQITHPMENGERRDGDGVLVPRSIINRFTCLFEGQVVVDLAMQPSIANNPYFRFEAVVPGPGKFQFTWYDDDGSVYRDARSIVIA